MKAKVIKVDLDNWHVRFSDRRDGLEFSNLDRGDFFAENLRIERHANFSWPFQLVVKGGQRINLSTKHALQIIQGFQELVEETLTLEAKSNGRKTP